LSLQDIDSTDPFVASVGWLIFDAFFYLLLGLYLDAVLPSQFGVRRHPLFCFSRFNEKKQYKKKVTEQRSPRTERTSLVASPVASSTGAVDDELPGEVEDADVRAERNRIESGELRPEDCAILIRNMRKEYKTSAGTKVAVRDLCLSMRDGECFALLGPNGAGKTTTISILTGLFAPSAGEVFVGGFDIATQRHKVHLSLGVCPQFDILYEELTPFEHLLYYARLKGVPAKEEKEHAESLLRKVGLAGDIGQRPSGSLSGGMKRRLSIAIALVGDPKVVLLDEFTTGLDPVSRRALWDIVADARHGRCILLTTHAMDEAETLSTRIGIMSLGRLKALGSHLQLKNKFGQGYRVSVSFLEQDAERVKSFMKRVLPTASIASDFAGTCLYEVPRADVRMSEVFRMMEENKVQAGIRDYGLSLTSMEDVFLQIVRDEEITPAVGK
jgi:ABC-type multidrug transport system ATPase subunit